MILTILKMHLEIAAAVDFLMKVLGLKNTLKPEQLDSLGKNLACLLNDRYRGHWYPDKPARGQAYRCIRINSWQFVDESLLQACTHCGIEYSRLPLPDEITIWIDPFEVCGRLGEHTEYFTIATFQPVTNEEPAPLYMEPETPAPLYMEPETPAPLYMEPETPAPLYMEPETPAPLYMEPETPAPLYMEPETPAPLYMEPETPAPLYMEPETPAPLYMEPETPAPLYTEPEKPVHLYTEHETSDYSSDGPSSESVSENSSDDETSGEKPEKVGVPPTCASPDEAIDSPTTSTAGTPVSELLAADQEMDDTNASVAQEARYV